MVASTYTGNALLNLLTRGVAWAAPVRVYVSLHTADPGVTGANEVTLAAWPSYVRVDAANGGAVGTGFAAAANKGNANAQELLWPAAMDGDNPITITHFALWDAAAGGNCLASGALTAPKTLAKTDEFVTHAGKLTASVT